MTTQKKTNPSNLKDNAPDGLELSEAEAKEARKEGAKEAAKEAAKDTYTYLTDGNLPGDPPQNQWLGHDDIQQYAELLDEAPEQLEKRLKEKDPAKALPQEKAYGLLALERNGKNRTPYVRLLMKHLDLKKEELPGGGPAYTNPVTTFDEL